jgi:hypothetical protein
MYSQLMTNVKKKEKTGRSAVLPGNLPGRLVLNLKKEKG